MTDAFAVAGAVEVAIPVPGAILEVFKKLPLAVPFSIFEVGARPAGISMLLGSHPK
jgi:hypothetical protein